MAVTRIMGSPRRYVQGPGAFRDLSTLATGIGQHPHVVADPAALEAEGEPLRAWVGGAAISRFGGEITAAEISRQVQAARQRDADVIIGFGGGKAIDAAKGVALELGVPTVILPTAASNDAPTSRLIVIYDDAHRIAEVRRLPVNPELVVVDSEVVARAPRHLLAAGIGDALSKVFESTACAEAGGLNSYGGRPPLAALTLSRCCYETIRRDAAAALRAVDAGTPDAALENVIEATILMSGLGFESGGLSLAHALTRGLSAHPATSRAAHGDMVAFGTLVQLVHQEHAEAEIADIARFARACGLPTTLAGLGLDPVSLEGLEAIAIPTLTAPFIGNVRRPLDRAGLVAALSQADTLGRMAR